MRPHHPSVSWWTCCAPGQHHGTRRPPLGGSLTLCPLQCLSNTGVAISYAGLRPLGASTLVDVLAGPEALPPLLTPAADGSLLKDVSISAAPAAMSPQTAGSHQDIGQPQAHSTPTTQTTPTFRHWPYLTPCMDTDAAALYNAARSAAMEGASLPRLDHTTSLQTSGHPADAMILRGITHGFSTQYSDPPVLTPTASYNHRSAVQFAAHIDAYVDKELVELALSGPYSRPPFTPWFVSSPMMSKEKSGGDGRRVIVDLSFPDGGINQHIAPHIFDGEEAVHNLPTINSAVSTIAAAPPGDIHMAVIDLSRAYRQFPVTSLDWPLLGISWRDMWSFDRRLPFGCRMSSYIMQSVAEFISRALARRRVSAHMYLDDILVISRTSQLAAKDYQAVLNLLGELGLDVAVHKLQPPSPAVIWLRIRIDVDNNTLSIHKLKLGQIKDCMARAAKCSYITKKHQQRLIGLANHLAQGRHLRPHQGH